MAVVDYGLEPQQDKADANGTITVEFSFVPLGVFWEINRISIKCDSLNQTDCSVYVDIVDDQYVMDITDQGNLNIADEAQPIIIPPGKRCIIQWTGASQNAIGKATIQYRVVVPDDV